MVLIQGFDLRQDQKGASVGRKQCTVKTSPNVPAGRYPWPIYVKSRLRMQVYGGPAFQSNSCQKNYLLLFFDYNKIIYFLPFEMRVTLGERLSFCRFLAGRISFLRLDLAVDVRDKGGHVSLTIA